MRRDFATSLLVLLAVTGSFYGAWFSRGAVRAARAAERPDGRPAPEADILSEQRTGWKAIRTVRITIEERDANSSSRFHAVSPTREFRTGQYFRLKIECNVDLHIYVLVRNADETLDVLSPARWDQPTLARAGQPQYIPPRAMCVFQPPAGQEVLRIIASPSKLPWMQNEELFKLANGDSLTPDEEAALSNLKNIRSQRLEAAEQDFTSRKSFGSLAEAARQIAAGALPQDCEVAVVEEVGASQVVSMTFARKDDKSLLVHDIVLKHR